MSKIEPRTVAHYRPPQEAPPPFLGVPPGAQAPTHSDHRHRSSPDAAWLADVNFRRMRAALNASEGNGVDRLFAGWRVRWRVYRLRVRLRQLGVHSSDLPPPREAFVRTKVPIAITDVAWHEQLRLWWWPPGLSPNIDA